MAFDQADYFFVPLLDGQYGIGQILAVDALPQDAVLCGLSLRRGTPGGGVPPLLISEIVAFVLAPVAPLNDGTWPLGGFDQIPRFSRVFDLPGTRALGFPDMPLHDTPVIEAFLSAWHRLYPWDAFGDLFDRIKRQDLDRPATAT